VGTGPFRLKQWRRSSLIVLERNPDYRERLYDAEPAPDDAEGQACWPGSRAGACRWSTRCACPSSPRHSRSGCLPQRADDILGSSAGSLPGEFVSQAMPNGKLAPNLAKRGIRAMRQVNSDTGFIILQHGRPGGGRLHAR
jgi:hypothetical protein